MNTINNLKYRNLIKKSELSALMSEIIALLVKFDLFPEDRPEIHAVNDINTPESIFKEKKKNFEDHYDMLSQTYDKCLPATESVYLKQYDQLRRKNFISFREIIKALLRTSDTDNFDDLHILKTLLAKFKQIPASSQLNATGLITNLLTNLKEENITKIYTKFNLSKFVTDIESANNKYIEFSNSKSTKVELTITYTADLRKACILAYDELIYSIDVIAFGNVSENCLNLVPELNGRIDTYSKMLHTRNEIFKKKREENKEEEENEENDRPEIKSEELKTNNN